MTLLVVAVAGIVLVLGALGVLLSWRRQEKALRERLQRVGAPLTGHGAATEVMLEQSIFRATTRRSRLSPLWDRIQARYPLINPPKALPRALLIGVGVCVGAWVAMGFLGMAGWWSPFVSLSAGAGGIWFTMGRTQAKLESLFIQQFPEVVDQIVRLSGAGVPPVEAIASVAEDAQLPVQPILREVTDALLAGLDADTALSMVSERLRLAEFTLFAAVIRLQRRAGGGVTEAFSNLSNTLRERRTVALKARASTAQTRLTLVVLMLMPPLVLAVQSVSAPESVDMLFNTEDGQFLLRTGIALVVLGLLVARQIAARGEK